MKLLVYYGIAISYSIVGVYFVIGLAREFTNYD